MIRVRAQTGPRRPPWRMHVGPSTSPRISPLFAQQHDAPAALHPAGELRGAVFLAGAAGWHGELRRPCLALKRACLGECSVHIHDAHQQGACGRRQCVTGGNKISVSRVALEIVEDILPRRPNCFVVHTAQGWWLAADDLASRRLPSSDSLDQLGPAPSGGAFSAKSPLRTQLW